VVLLGLEDGLRRFQQREAIPSTLRVRFAATVSAPNARRAQGVLVVRRPDRLRLRLWSPFGLTVLDYVRAAETATLLLPLEGLVLRDAAIDTASSFSPSAFVPAFLLERRPAASNCRVDGPWIDCHDGTGGAERALRIDRRDGSLRRETIIRQGRPDLMLHYDDYRETGGVWLPYRIEATAAGSSARATPELRIEVEAYELNPALDESVFDEPRS